MFKIGGYQTGFTEGDNTLVEYGLDYEYDHGWNAKKRSQKLFCCVDTRKAYDIVNREMLLRFLNEAAQKSGMKEKQLQ